MKSPKKPTLNTLRGCTVISPHLREALGINEGVLIGEVKNWNNIKILVNNYFEHVEDYSLKGDVLFNTVLGTLEDLSKLKLIDESNKQQKKNGSDCLILVNDYAKAREAKQKEEERIRRQEEEKEEKAKMLYNGKWLPTLPLKMAPLKSKTIYEPKYLKQKEKEKKAKKKQ
ncbi:unnamed protein product [Rhizopus stolonifer]